ncbi:protein-L-isoaspartate O-methyltransferase family protein [Methylocapsa acidiphila]|uniref:protein-L-isoaspartate O-methyltransferase family protein n=1 Tax=Methylocapsa acidiphila TaxID=133552 RepID=UPI00041BB253|nr:protein-L-isoaspartate(D-aspartate) O-methyltransferase [Methylocapsa acidiphila]
MEPMWQEPARKDEALASAQAKAAFLLTMRARGIQDLGVLRALELVPREIFVPHRYADLARRQLALPLRCGQTLPEPWLAARMIEALAPSPNCRVLEIGTGSGYATALLARLAREVISVERFQSLAIEAGARLARLAIDNAGVTWGDGLTIGPAAGPFDRIIVQGALAEIPASLAAALAPDGVLVTARPDPAAEARRQVVRMTRNEAGDLDETVICPCRLQAILPGEARAL